MQLHTVTYRLLVVAEVTAIRLLARLLQILSLQNYKVKIQYSELHRTMKYLSNSEDQVRTNTARDTITIQRTTNVSQLWCGTN